MNCTYRSIWNDTTGTFVAVSENAKSSGKKTSSGRSVASSCSRFALQALALGVALSFGANVYALPTGGAVAAGSASISAGALGTTINQSTQNAAINWQSFNIASGEAVRFNQPSSSSVTLNRVLGADPSSIFGSLSANGKVFLVNPNGILFGQGASVNVGGLVASTLNIADADFMAGNYKFSGASSAAVLNQGSINADGGYVALLGANVGNNGVISAKLGSVALAAGNAMTLDVAGDGLLNVTVNQGAVNALVQNGGLIQADGGQVLLTAQAAGSLLQSAVNNSGVIQAQTIQKHNGTIKLMGDMQSGTVNVAGRLDASAPNGGDGGFIETSAAHVKVADNAIITTQSVLGKTGTWLIDPVDFTIATAGGSITPAALVVLLGSNDVTVHTTATAPDTATDRYGTVAGAGDITVANDVVWGAATTLTLDAVHNVIVNADITATTGSLVLKAGTDVIANANPGAGITMTTAGGNMTWTAGNDIWVKAGVVGGITATGTGANKANMTWTAGRDIKIDSAVTTTDANFTACCGRDINITAAMTMTRGTGTLKAGNDGSGLGVAGVGGTVVFSGAGHYTVTGPATDVGVYYTPTSYAAPHDYSGNFTLSGGGTLATMTPHMLVFAKGNDKDYDGGTAATLSFKGTPTLGGDVTLVPGTATFDSPNAGANVGIGYTGYSLGGVDAAKFSLWDSCVAPFGRTSANITAAPLFLTVTASNVTKPYGQTIALTDFTSVGLQGGETIGTVTLTSPGTPASASVATYAITASDARGGTFVPGNYSISYVNGILSVVPVALTITASNVSKAYGQAPTLSAFTAAGLLNGETVGSVTETSPGQPATANVAAYAITPSNATGGTFVPANYTIGYVNGVLTVAPIPLTVTASNVAKSYGQTPTLSAFTTAGLINGETVGSVTETSPGQPATANVAAYAITPSNATGGTFVPANYTIGYVNGVLTVAPIPLTVTASNVAKSYGQTPALTAFTTAGLIDGDTVGSVTETSPGQAATAAVVGSPYAITPSNATGGTFVPANYTIGYVNGVLTVAPIPLTVTASDVTKTFGQTPTLSGFTTTALVNGETVGSVTETSPGQIATAPVVGSPYPIAPSAATGGTFTPSNYTIGYVDGKLAVIPATLTVTANDALKVYGQTITLAPTAFTTTGLVNADTVTSVSEVSPGTVATAPVLGSPYPITPSDAVGSYVPGNYTVNYVNGVLTVTPIPLLVTANDATKIYGNTPILSGFTTVGLVNSETVGSVTITSVGTPAATSASGSTYLITPSAATGGTFTPSNYEITYEGGALTVMPLQGEGTNATAILVRPWSPTVAVIRTPPELLTLAAPVPQVVPVIETAVVVQQPAPVVAPVEKAPEIYVAPQRPRKQDRN